MCALNCGSVTVPSGLIDARSTGMRRQAASTQGGFWPPGQSGEAGVTNTKHWAQPERRRIVTLPDVRCKALAGPDSAPGVVAVVTGQGRSLIGRGRA
jgi:hypothetical protein